LIATSTPGQPQVAFDTDGRIPALDGLRGIAILLVMFHHFWVFSAPPTHGPGLIGRAFGGITSVVDGLAGSGWIGVDLFFVLSGFLITGILLKTRGAPRYFRNFYLRRALRIFPLYFTFLLLLFLAPEAFVPSVEDSRQQVYRAAGWFWSHTVNLLIAIRGWESVPVPVGHLWSLAVEEQFYLVWPLVVFAVPGMSLRNVCVALVCGSLVLRCLFVLLGAPPVTSYVLTFTRMDAIAMGAIAAIILRDGNENPRHRTTLKALSWVAVLALLPMYLSSGFFDSESVPMSTVGLTALAIAFAYLVVRSATASPDSSGLSRTLKFGPLRLFGHYSYSLYLFHVPILFILQHMGVTPRLFPPLLGSTLPGKFAFVFLAGACSLMVAYATWRLVEAPFLALKGRFGYSVPSSPSVATRVHQPTIP